LGIRVSFIVQQLHAIIHGRVQGVSFRFNAQAEAQRLKLVGWVRNRSDGSVETVAVGEKTALDTYLGWLQHGPTGARVTKVDSTWIDSTEAFSSFEIRHGF
jgi:acylphosphatase